MKVTAIIPDNLISEVKQLSKGKNLTDSLLIALREWVHLKNINQLNLHIKKHPLQFQSNYSAGKTREMNRIR